MVTNKAKHAGRTLVVFGLGMAILYGLVALAGSWRPELGLDLQGGTRITLTAQGNPSGDSLDEARTIIDQRVNGSGVTEAEVTTQSGRFVVVEIPGERRRDLIEVVQRQAQLRFRLVACTQSEPERCAGGAVPEATPDFGNQIPEQQPGQNGQGGAGQNGTGQNGTGQNGTGGQGGAGQDGADGADGEQAPGAANRPPVSYSAGEQPSPTEVASPSETASQAPTDEESAGPEESPSGSPTEAETIVPDAQGSATVEEALEYMRAPTGPAVELFNTYSCDADGTLLDAEGEAVPLVDDPNQPLVACSPPEEATGRQAAQPSQLFLLTESVIEGTELNSADAAIPTNDVSWIVQLDIGGQGREDFAQISRELVCPSGGPECDQFAIVLDGSVISAPFLSGVIPNGQAQISGNFTETSANALATSLRFGALPIAFQDDVTSETVGPTLAGSQLSAGLIAGGFGLALVMLYCLVYYRGLGLVVLGSLAVAALITYALVLLLSETAGFTLTLPGIAGFIIAVGVTADSFILFFERIRDEMREGKSMRVAVETGWKRAKVTRLAANTVSLLSAAVLYIFATGAVKGFGFALGLSTLIDLAVLFWFTKPAVSYLARFKFFNGGGALSGLSPESLGMDREPARATAGGRA